MRLRNTDSGRAISGFACRGSRVFADSSRGDDGAIAAFTQNALSSTKRRFTAIPSNSS